MSASATWTCADGHTHNVTKLGNKVGGPMPFSATAGYDTECRTCGDKINSYSQTAGTGPPALAVTLFTASSTAVSTL